MASLADPDAAKGITENYQYLVGDSAFYLEVDDGAIEVRDGRAEDPAVVLTADEDTFIDIATGKTSGSAAVAAGSLSITGDQRAVKRLGKVFSRKGLLAGVGQRSGGA